MRNLFPSLFLCFVVSIFISITPLYGQENEKKVDQEITIKIIKEIVFKGNTLHKSKSLERKIKTKRKQLLNKKKLQNDVKLLFETGDFDDVTVSLEDMEKTDSKGQRWTRVIFKLDERPLIKRIDFKGNKKIRSGSFSDKIQSEEGLPFDRFKVSLDARSILEYYRDEGYANVKVEHYTSLDPKKKKLILTFFIIEGERVIVKNVQISGTRRYTERKMRRVMKTRRKKIYKNEILAQDRRDLISYYKNRGHLDVEVSSPSIQIDEELNEAKISITINEGPQYRVGTISISSSTIFKKKRLRKVITLKKGKTFDQRRLDESIGNLSNLYADKGYLRTEVFMDPVRQQEKGIVDFDVNFRESTVVYVDGIYVDGNSYTKSYVIKREVLLRPGDIFSAGRLRRSVERIYNLGFLEDVQVDVQQPRDPNLADLIFTVKEGKPGILSAGAGFSSVDRFVGTLQVQHTNLFGKAQRVNVSYEFGARRQNFTIGWTDPWLFGYRMSGGIDLFNTVRRRDFPGNRNAFREKRRGISGRLGPRISDRLGLLFGYTIQTTEIFDVDASIKERIFPTFNVPREDALNTDAITQVKSSFLTEVAVDTRDNRFDPTKGTRNAVSVELAGGAFGGDIHYYKPQVTSSWFFPTFWKFVFSLSGRVAWVNHFSPSNNVPTSERFFLGGADNVRGYDTNSIAPRIIQSNEAGIIEIKETPGRILTVFNAEYKFPIVRERNRTIFQGAFFFDVGGTWLKTEDVILRTGALDRRLKAGVGFGFRFKTPVFPIRLDFAIPLNPRDADESRAGDSRGLQPYFTIGNIF